MAWEESSDGDWQWHCSPGTLREARGEERSQGETDGKHKCWHKSQRYMAEENCGRQSGDCRSL